MKFGDSLPRRSVPKWSAYNVNYNQLKHLIKIRTSSGSALPTSIPGAGISRWHDLENELSRVIAVEYENVALFLRSKQGEIERRLSHLESQVKMAKKAVDNGALDRPIIQARKYQRLVKDVDGIGDEIENLSRFAGVQKTAFRKILKKYRKWTGSTALQHRLDVDVFSSGALRVDYAHYLQRLSAQSSIITSQLAGPMLSGSRFQSPRRPNTGVDGTLNQSNANLLTEACSKGPLHFDVALASVPYGEAGGSAYFWVHPDNLDEAEALLLRHMHLLEPTSPSTPVPATNNGSTKVVKQTRTAFYDNVQRFSQDASLSKPSHIALTTRWTLAPEALVTFSSLVPKSSSTETVKIRRKDVSRLLQRSFELAQGKAQSKLQEYLSEHRDVKPLAEVHSARSRYVGINNASEIGTWATLDSSILIAPIDSEQVGDLGGVPEAAEAFPHSVLHVRWEFSRIPEVVRIFQTSHLAEVVHDFSIEKAAILTVFRELEQPSWRQLLETDIRRVPSTLRKPARSRENTLPPVPVSSGPSSTDGPSDSIYSAVAEPSSATSPDASPILAQREQSFAQTTKANTERPTTTKKKRARIAIPPPQDPPAQRYWNEFDDGDSDVNPEEGYAIYVDPNEPSMPGAETVSRVFGAMYDSLSRGSKRVAFWLPIKSKQEKPSTGERTPLLHESQPTSPNVDLESSGSDTDELIPETRKTHRGIWKSRSKFRRRQLLSRRQKALENTLFQFYSGLIALSYVLLLMSAVLFSAGRKGRVLEVDAGIVAGVVTAEACAGISIVLICMRRKPLGAVHWGLLAVNVATIVVIGVAELALMFMGQN